MIEPCDAESVRIVEELQRFSDREVAKIIQAYRRNVNKCTRVVKVPYMGLRKQSSLRCASSYTRQVAYI